MRVGVVVCAYTLERWELLGAAIASVEEQSVEPALFLVVDHNDELLAGAADRWPRHRVVPNRYERGLSGARNTGVGEASACDVIVFLDDDAVAEQGWLQELVEPFSDRRVGLTAGQVLPGWSSDPPPWFPDEFLWVVGCSYLGLPTTATDIRNPIGASMAVRRTVFEEVGLFHTGVGRIGATPFGCEETELGIRARTAGYVTRYVPGSRVRHHVGPERRSFDYFVRRCWSEGRSKARVSAIAGTDQALESERTYVTRTITRGIVTRLAKPAVSPGQVRASLALVAGCVVAASGYAVERLRQLTGRSPRGGLNVPRLEPGCVADAR